MFCPGCGTLETQQNQFCRACGTDLQSIRLAITQPDSITASAVNAREDIGRAIAQKIREIKNSKDLAEIAEDVLPEIEKFLESPVERRLRRFRLGSLLTFIGVAAAIAFPIIYTMKKEDAFLFITGAGIICAFVGLAMIINGIFFTLPPSFVPDKTIDGETQRKLDYLEPQTTTTELKLPQSNQIFTSVVEDTTQHLREKENVLRK